MLTTPAPRSPLRSAAAAALFFALGAPLSGCCDEHDAAVCGGKVTEAISSFNVMTVTGSDSSDADIQLCVSAKSSLATQCGSLETSNNNFEEDTVETFEVPLAVDAGDLDSFWLYNAGGAILGNNEWEIEGLRVEATLAGGGSVVLYDEHTISCDNDIDVGDRYLPLSCAY